MANEGVSGRSVAVALVGVVLAWSAIKGKKISVVVRDLIYGQDPSGEPNVNAVGGLDATQGGLFLDPSNPATFGSIGQLSPTVSAGGLTPAQIYQVALNAGFNPISAIIMTAISMAEDPGGNPNALNNNPATGDLSYGLWQINMIGNLGPARLRAFGISNNNQLFDPATNAHAAYIISHGGTVFTDWTTFTSGKYKQFLGAAQAASHG